MNRTRLIRLLLSAAALATAACEGKHRREFKPEEIIGRWQLQAESMTSVKERTGVAPRDSRIIFVADGRFDAIEMPVESPASDGAFYVKSGTGTWKLSPHMRGFVDMGMDRMGIPLFIETDRSGALSLVHEVGVPESSERWIWKKVP